MALLAQESLVISSIEVEGVFTSRLGIAALLSAELRALTPHDLVECRALVRGAADGMGEADS